jgi:membrane associated rhomboid family serine protease
MFMHAGFGHIFFNMFALVMFGRIIEGVLGSKKFFILYFISGIFAALLHLLLNHLISGEPTIMVGASGAVFGVLGLFTVLFPDVKLMIIFFPVPIKAKYLMPGILILELFFGVANFELSNIAHFAHLGGAIAGVIFALFWKHNRFKFY